MKKRIVVAIIQNSKGEYLLCQRSEKDDMGNLWEFPGGGVEAGEKLEDALVREIKEELNLDIEVDKQISMVKTRYKKDIYSIIAYEVNVKGGNLNLNVHSGMKWLKLDNIVSNELCPADYQIVQVLRKIEQKHISEKSDIKHSKRTILLLLADLIINSYYISPVWIIKKILIKMKVHQDGMIFQNITDVYIIFRAIFPLMLMIFHLRGRGYAVACAFILFEMIVAHLSHFLSNKFNSAGAGKVTAIRRTVLIVFINYFSFISIYAYLYSFVLPYGVFDLIFFSLTTIISASFDYNAPTIMKFIKMCEGFTGVFYLGYIVATIIGWNKAREEI